MKKKNVICHYGINGQKWGERKYQYKDGSLTPAGKNRYRKRGNKRRYNNRVDSNKNISTSLKIGATVIAGKIIFDSFTKSGTNILSDKLTKLGNKTFSKLSSAIKTGASKVKDLLNGDTVVNELGSSLKDIVL